MSEILRKCATKVRKNVDLVSKFVDKLSALWSSCGVWECSDVTKMNESFVLVTCSAPLDMKLLYIN